MEAQAKDFVVENVINIRPKEEWLRDILECILEALFFVKSSGNTVPTEKSFHDEFTYPKIANDPGVDEFIKKVLDNNLKYVRDDVGVKHDTLKVLVKFKNLSAYERWSFTFRIQAKNDKGVPTDDRCVAKSLKQALAFISEKFLHEDYEPLPECATPKIGHSIRYDVEVTQENFPQPKSLFSKLSFFN